MRKRWRYVLLFVVVAALASATVRFGRSGSQVKPGTFVQLDLGGLYREAPPTGVLERALFQRADSFLELLALLRRIRDDKRVEGVVVRVTSLSIGWAKAQDIRNALLDVRSAGKRVIGLLEQEAGGATLEYYVASAARPLYLSPSATAPLNGLAAQVLFFGGVWEKLDVNMNVEKIREYKTAGDSIANKEMTAAHREMTNSLLDSMNEQVVVDIAGARDLTEAEVRAWIDKAPSTGRELEAAKLCDGVRHIQDLETELSPETPFLSSTDYARQGSPRRSVLADRPQVALVYAAGNIVSGEGSNGPNSTTIGSDSLSKALHDAQEDEDIKAIILRVDSPGGSALASDIIWRATQSARKRKPLVVSMSDVAASGGYYIAAGADRIIAAPGTLTGSIGVVSMRPYIRNLLRKLGIHSETITRGRFADLNDLTSPIDTERRKRLVSEMEHIYSVFVDRVAEGRHLTSERVNEIGRGRVWTGVQAKQVGLIDELGGFPSAEAAAKQLASIPADQEVEFVFFPRHEGVFGALSELVETRTQARIELPTFLQGVSEALLLPFEEHSILTLMPERIELR